ncbi:DUF3888 domain-containing protein [Bacillus sp. BRMEA1]|uniref:DUF3888 domain-containing protein n=1 Tax=Neobacillus endophyticus TaxID=2738405 RepID=UPI0015632A13|nr:DUF3888 domain-containing protein [Neobacillus endophyticus]NRD80864.1 DUF3888 domain-containing protein [Neobacillus endophyticus]
MKKSILIVIACSFLVSFTPVRADTVTKNNVQLRDDLIIHFLYPLISKELEKHYGEIKQYYCANILEIKKLRQGSYFFDVTVQVTTFEGAHNPPYDLVTIKFTNSDSKPWRAIEFKGRRLKPNEERKCRFPL